MRNILPGSVLALLAAGQAGAITADHAATVAFTDVRVQRGAVVYATSCASCHGVKLEGAAGPVLNGTGFLTKWTASGGTVGDFFRAVKNSMPLNAPGSLSDTDYIDVVSFILASNGYLAGPQALTAQTLNVAMKQASGVQARPHLLLPLAASHVVAASSVHPTDAELTSPRDADWLMYNKTLTGERFSALAQINRQNAKDLSPSCIFQAGEVGSFQASPVIYEGLMYVTTAYNTYAIDAQSCHKVWSHQYPVDNTPVLLVSRGVAIYRGKVFRATPNGHLLAIDAKTGALLWDTYLSEAARGYWLSAAPVAYEGKVYIGEAGADWGANAHIYALDAENGRVSWTFNVIPTGHEFGADTWEKGAEHGGGSSWSSYTVQDDKHLLFVPVGNASPDFDGPSRPGKNLFTDSVVVLNTGTGQLQWYVQQVQHDLHDWDTAAAPVIYDQGGKQYMAVASKDGWLYLYDRHSHALLSKLEVSTHTAANAPVTRAGTHYCPGIVGGVEWNGPAYLPHAHLLVVNSVDWCAWTQFIDDTYREGLSYLSGIMKSDPVEDASGWTKAFDAGTGAPRWSRHWSSPMLAAVTPTAGDVVFTGDMNGNFLTLDATNGDTLYQFNTGGALAGGISTYEAAGRQFVAVVSGNTSRSVWLTTGAATVIIFALPVH